MMMMMIIVVSKSNLNVGDPDFACKLGQFDLDIFSKCCVLQANSVKIDKN